MKFPSRNNFIDDLKTWKSQYIDIDLSKTEENIHDKKCKVIERVEILKKEHPVLNEIIKKALPFLPSPFDKISQALYDILECPKEDKINEVLKFLGRIEGQTNKHYQYVTSELTHATKEISHMNTIVAKDSTVQEIIGILRGSYGNKTIHEKIENLKRQIDETKQFYQKLTSVLYEGYGLSWLPPNYFDVNRSSYRDFKDWEKGFPFKLPAIKSGYEFRREKVLDVIKDNLEHLNLQIILGPSGYSKSTILMEIMCDYFDDGYQILYCLANPDIKNGEQIVKFIQNQILAFGYKTLVVVDDAQTERTATIFYVIDSLLSFHQPKNIKFLLTARIPDYHLFLEEENLSQRVADQETRKAIRKLTSNRGFLYELPPFEPDEIEGFILKYQERSGNDEKKSIENEVRTLYEETRGNPIMVKFFIIGHRQGLEQDVRERRSRYLNDPNNMQAMLVCSMLDLANLQINDVILENTGLKKYANRLKGDLLYRSDLHKIWQTIHQRWDLQLFSLLYSSNDDEDTVLKRKEYLKQAITCIFDLHDEKMTTSVITAVYSMTFQKLEGFSKTIIPIEIIEDVVGSNLPNYLSDPAKLLMYAVVMAPKYHRNSRYQDAMKMCDRALEIDNSYVPAWSNKGAALVELGKPQEAIECLDVATNIEPFTPSAWYNKAQAFHHLRDYRNAKRCYNKAIKTDPNFAQAWCGKGNLLSTLGNEKGAKKCYNKATRIDPNYAIAWCNKGSVFVRLGKPQEAIECLDIATNIEPFDFIAWSNKGNAHSALGAYEYAIKCQDKSIELRPNYIRAWYGRACSKVKQGDLEGGFEDLKKALEIGNDGYMEKDQIVHLAKTDPDLESIRDDERFKEIVSR